MTKLAKPAGYAAPLKSRKAIIAFLLDHEDYYRWHATCSPLAWNVKVHNVDLSYDNLLRVYTQDHDEDNIAVLSFPEFDEPARARYEEVEDLLFYRACEDACTQVTETDAYSSLWSGEAVDVEYGFEGRSGGWLLMTLFQGRSLTGFDPDGFEQYLQALPYDELVKLYKLVVQNDHDFRPEAVRQEVEYHAAFDFFVNCCADIVRPDMTQRELAFPLDERHGQ